MNTLTIRIETLIQKIFWIKLVCLFFCLVLLPFQKTGAQEIPFITEPETGQHNNIRIYLMEKADEITNSAFNNIDTHETWINEKDQRYSELVQSLGLNYMPLTEERPDLNVNYTGKIQMDGYHIEKLYFESLPSLYVPANLYVPDNIRSLCPAILYLCGHSESQKVAYQPYAHKFAQLGFICLIIETTHQGEVCGDHHGCYSKGWFNWYSRGYSPAGVEVWNALRALDFLCSRKEVDTGNIGVTGRSGGGAQTWFVSAIDKRVKAACPGVGATTLNEQILTKTIDWHCDCMSPINTFCRDFSEIGALIAPRSLLIEQGDRDRLTTIEGVKELYKKVKKIYGFYNTPQNVELIETQGGHGATAEGRKKMLSFFLEELMGKKVPVEKISDVDFSPEKMLSSKDLRVYKDGVPADDRTTTIYDSFIRIPEPPLIKNKNELFAYRDSVICFLEKNTFGAFPDKKCSFEPHMVFRSIDKDNFGSNIYTFVPEEGWRLRLDMRWKNNPKEKKPLLIVLKNPGDQFGEVETFSKQLGEKWNVAYFNTRGVEDAGWENSLQWHIRRSSAWIGRTIASMQVYDLLRCLEFCRTLPGIDSENISIAARDGMGAVALYAALLDGNVATLILKNPPPTQNESSCPDGKGQAVEMLNCLRVTDVCQLPALMPQTNVKIIGEVPESYQWAENTRCKIGSTSFQKE
ncbi:hypothetical protein GM418_21515 [Maribellus comscasis]|uniref:Acetyl xylan esterase domain-containing protein n=1 Tax=Maribellus comscasis TaxID=2681766 RepID=A0A6I6JUE2_9BACT|nr:acetylxylan esterase [Maribellus comscasis]QGY46151.1 hypothetical protein GM418_21515 [Maribellus comscasis]